MYAVTGASGQLGRLVLNALLDRVDAAQIVALVRTPSKLADLAARGVDVRAFDYADPETLSPALEGVTRLLLISSSEVGQREAQHGAVIAAAKAAGVAFIAYTSILHADTSPLDLAIEHRATEALIAQSGIPHALLRNGWYTENYTGSAAAAVEHGAVLGSAGDGRISAAPRADYAAAAVAVLVGGETRSQTYELAADTPFTLADYAATLAEVSGKPVAFHNLPQAAYQAALEAIGLPAPIAHMIAESDAKAADGALFDDSGTLGRLIGRPTGSLRDAVAAQLRD